MTRHDDDLVLIRLAIVMRDTFDQGVYAFDVHLSRFELVTEGDVRLGP